MEPTPFIPFVKSDSLSVADVFGPYSELALRSETANIVATGMGDSVLQCVAIVVILLYIYIIVRYSDVVLTIVSAAIGGLMLRRMQRRKFNLIVQRNFEIALAISGVVVTTLVAVRIILTDVAGVGDTYLPSGVLPLAIMVVLALAATIAFEYVSLKIVGCVTERADICDEILQMKLLHFSAAVVSVIPLGMVYLSSAPQVSEVCFYLIIIQCIISVILFVKESLMLFISQRISILHCILYLCTLEILPLSVLLAPIMRG